jgi:hypothetical protein
MMRAAQPHFRQLLVGAADETGLGEDHQFHTPPDRGIMQEQGRG